MFRHIQSQCDELIYDFAGWMDNYLKRIHSLSNSYCSKRGIYIGNVTCSTETPIPYILRSL